MNQFLSTILPGGKRTPSRRRSDIGLESILEAAQTKRLQKPQQVKDQEKRKQ